MTNTYQHGSVFFCNAGCSTRIMEQIKMLLMCSTTSHQDSHEDGIPQLCEQGDSIGQNKRYNGVCSRKNHE